MPDPLHPPTEAMERLKSDARQQRDGGCVRQADDLDALLGYVAALRSALIVYLLVDVHSEMIPTEDGEWEEIFGRFDQAATAAAEQLVLFGLWERHPTEPGLYRPKPDHVPDAGEKVGEVADGQ